MKHGAKVLYHFITQVSLERDIQSFLKYSFEGTVFRDRNNPKHK